MFTKRTTAALFAIAIASSLIVASSFVGFAFAAKKEGSATYPKNTITNSDGEDKSSSRKSAASSAGDISRATGDTNGLSTKELKKLSKCQSGSAADGDLTLAEVKDCYSQVFDQGQGQGKDQSSSARGNDQSDDQQGEQQVKQGEQQVKPTYLQGQKTGLMREGFPF
ncbi:MAG: hypothetical protein ACJ71J_15510 [Nitrososphaeraceae archaeon]